MTLKHIGFLDSPTMRELARQAVKNGTVKPPALSEIVKEAQSTYEPSDDLFTDLVRLASGLRDRGYANEAAALEQKIFAFKKAKDSGEDFLDKAHPEGDTKMGDAQDGLGEVETQITQHQKILEMVNKQPTGKQAAQANGLLQAVAYVLKTSQQAKLTNIEDVEKSEAKIKQANELLSTSTANILALIKTAYSKIPFDSVVFSAERVMADGGGAYTQLYATAAKINPAQIASTLTRYNAVFGGGTPSAQYVFDRLNSLNGPDLKAYCDQASPVIMKKYFPQAKPGAGQPQSAVDMIGTMVSDMTGATGLNQLYNWIKSDGSMKAAASEISQIMINDFNKVLDQTVLDAAAQNQKTKLKNLFVSAVTTPVWDPIEHLGKQRFNPAVFDDECIQVAKFLDDVASKASLAAKNKELQDELGKVTAVFGGSGTDVMAALEGVVPAINKLRESISSLSTVAVAKVAPVDVQMVQGWLGSIRSLAGQLKKWLESKGAKSPDYIKYVPTYNNMVAMWNALRSVKQATSFDELANAIAANGGDKFTSLDDLQNRIGAWANGIPTLLADNLVLDETGLPIGTRASATPDMVKTSQSKDPFSTAPASVKNVSTPKNVSAPNAAAQGLAKANMNDPKEAAVAVMQQYLAYFAQSVAQSKDKFKDFNPMEVAQMVRTGPKVNPAVNSYDGKWGEQTAAALAIAKKYADQLGLSGLDPKARYVNKASAEDTKEAAEKNQQLLDQSLQQLGAKGPGTASSAIMYDKLPAGMKFDQSELTVNAESGVNVVTPNEMASLAALYAFLVNKMGVQPQSVSDPDDPMKRPVRGFTAQQWVEKLKWFMSRAKWLWSQAKDDKARDSATSYHEDATRLWNQFTSYGKTSGLYAQQDWPSQIVPEGNLPGGFGGTAGRGGPGSGAVSGRTTNERSGPGGGASGGESYEEGMEGSNWGSPRMKQLFNVFPIWPMADEYKGMIDLRQAWYGDILARFKIGHNPVLNIAEFQGLPARTMIQKFFSGRSDVDPNMEYQRFLNTLSTSINKAVAGWNQAGEIPLKGGKKSRPNPQQTMIMGDLNSDWQEAINKQKDELGKYLSS